MTENMPPNEGYFAPQPPQGQPVQQMQPPQAQMPMQAPSETTPLVLGILSIVFAGIIGLVLSIIGLSKSKKALAYYPMSGKVKGGKICSIIGLVFSIIAIIVSIALIALGFGIFGSIIGEDGAVREAANTTLEKTFNPTPEERAAVIAGLDQGFEMSNGVSLSQLGITSEEFANWLYDGMSYKIKNVDLNYSDGVSTAVVHVEATTRSLSDFENNINMLGSSLGEDALRGVTTEADVYRVIGDVVKQAMDETPLTSKEVLMEMSKVNGQWVPNNSTTFALEAFTK